MKTLLYLVFIISYVSRGQGQDNKLIAQFGRQAEQWKAAYNAGDSAQFAKLYTADATYISSHVSGLVAEGRVHVLAYLLAGQRGGGHVDEIAVLSVHTSRNLATVLCSYQATNSGITVTGRNLLVMKRIGKRWLIVTHITVV